MNAIKTALKAALQTALSSLWLASLLWLGACSDDGDDAEPAPDTGAADTGDDTQTVDSAGDPAVDTAVDIAPDVDNDAPDARLDPGPETDAGGTIAGREISERYGQIIFNEVLIDGTAEGDPNGDGDADSVEDQFVELVNVHDATIDLEGFTLIETHLQSLPRHTFATGDALETGRAVVVFGGGDAPDATASSLFFTANAADPGIPFGLHLAGDTDDMLLLDPDGAVVARFCYGAGEGDCALEPAADASLTRSPDLTGEFVAHTSADGAGDAAFSPGTRVDGSPF